MKIKVKTEKIVVEETDIEIPELITKDNPHFMDVIKYLFTLDFIGGSHHDSFKDYLGTSQGGRNSSSITYIETLCDKDSMGYPLSKITIRVGWDDQFIHKKSSILIFKR